MFADLDAGNRRVRRLELATVLRVGFQVPEVDGGGAAAHPEDDDTLVPLLEVGRGLGQPLDEAHPGHGEQRRPGDVLQEMPAVRHEEIAGHRAAPRWFGVNSRVYVYLWHGGSDCQGAGR